jgi:hypothetical protein
MNHIAASFIRAVTRQVTEGSGPPNQRLDEWAVYQQDLKMSQLAEQALKTEVWPRVADPRCAGEIAVAK